MDQLLVCGQDQLRKFQERLDMPGSQATVFLQLACLQRIFLETYARLEWLVTWLPHLLDVDSSFQADGTIMGAFTDDLNLAADLHCVGIPLWLIRPFSIHSITRVDKLVTPLDETWNEQLPLRGCDSLINVCHSNPPHELLYAGLPNRYT
jgi:hypothetical protein